MRDHRIVWALVAALLAVAGVGAAGAQSAPAKSLHDTLDHKFILGFQGWFACPKVAGGDNWGHWKGKGGFAVDMFPDVSDFPADELCPTGLKGADGAEVKLFSDQNPATVDHQFGWMRHYGLDGVALQRFANELSDPSRHALVDKVLSNVRAAAERHEVAFFVMYDLSGLSDDRLDIVADDWAELVKRDVPNSAPYQHDGGKPVLGLWGLGFAGRPISAPEAQKLVEKLRAESAGVGGLTIVAGAPAGWRTGDYDASDNPAWKTFWPNVDIISPWTVGRYKDDSGADQYRQTRIAPDLAEAARIHVRYMPVVYPGTSHHNLDLAMTGRDDRPLNYIPRECGRFYWRQLANAISAGATMVYGAMFDEVNEGTALFKVAEKDIHGDGIPPLVALDADGCALSSDFYLRMTGLATEKIHAGEAIGQTIPPSLR